MRFLELLSPARNADIGIAAVDCGADAVYIAGPAFGARKDAGNPVEEVARLCEYAHRFGVKVFVTVNTTLRDDELPELHAQMLAEQEAGADAFIIRDPRICSWDDITIPLHASTQCAIRDVARAREFEALGCTRIVLERELPLSKVREICAAVNCEVEFFVHGALCVCYSGECRLSEWLDGRSADRGECIQACRSLYDLVDASGKVLVRNKALLSLKDYDLHRRLRELAEAGICSFKIEGRLKNISYVRNVTRQYSTALDALVAAHPDLYRRASFGRVTGGFEPKPEKTFNRGYTELFLDGKRGSWACMDTPKGMGEQLGTVARVVRNGRGQMEVHLKLNRKDTVLANGDGFAFVAKDGITGFRGDLCDGPVIRCKDVPSLKEGAVLYRNIDTAFEKELERNACRRELDVELNVRVHGKWTIDLIARSEDGRELTSPFKADLEKAENRERAEDMIRSQLGKRSGHYSFRVGTVVSDAPGGALPLLGAATLNSMRRLVAEDLDRMPCGASYQDENAESAPAKKVHQSAIAMQAAGMDPLMRSKYCIRYELGLCPVHQGASDTGPLFLINNGRRLALGFDCKACEMTVSAG